MRRELNNVVVYTVPVPYGWSIEQAWEAEIREDPLPNLPIAGWANVIVYPDGRFVVDRDA